MSLVYTIGVLVKQLYRLVPNTNLSPLKLTIRSTYQLGIIGVWHAQETSTVRGSVPPVESPHLIVERPGEVHGEHALAEGQVPVEADDQDLILLELRHICRRQILQQQQKRSQ